MKTPTEHLENLRLAIVDPEGRIIAAKAVPTAAELLNLAEQARSMIRDCEQIAQQLKAPATPRRVPYS